MRVKKIERLGSFREAAEIEKAHARDEANIRAAEAPSEA